MKARATQVGRTAPRRFSMGLLGLVLLTGFTLSAGAAPAPDAAGTTTALRITTGTFIHIPDPAGAFGAIRTPASTKAVAGTVILVPDLGTNPNWPGVIGPLRTALPRYGWSTLSITPPAIDASGKQPASVLEAATGRLQAALAYVQANGGGNVVLIGHGFGAALAAAYLAGKSPSAAVRGLIGIGWLDPAGSDGHLDGTRALTKISVPILDVYGNRDREAVIDDAEARARAARGAGKAYRQQEMDGADHDFTDVNGALVQVVRGWLRAHFQQHESPFASTKR